MKLNKIFAAFMLIAAVAFAACEGPDIPVDPGKKPDGDTTKVEGVAPDTTGWNIPAECLTVAQAREICAKLESGATTGTKYYVKGWVKKLASKHEEGVTQHNNAVFYIEDVKGANSQEDFEAFQVFGPNGSKITSLDQVVVGDYVVLYGELTNYSGTYETVGKGAAYIWKSTNPLLTGSSSTPTTPENEELIIPEEAKAWNIPAEAIDVLKAREICQGLESDAKTETKYYVMGYVKKLHNNHASGVSGYGNATFYMENTKGSNSDNDFLAFQVYGPDGNKITNPDVVQVGDFVVVYGELTNYMGNTYETVGKGAAYIWKSTNPALGGNSNTGNNPTELVGNGTYENPYTALDVIALGNTTKDVSGGKFYVKAFIVGQINGMNMSGLELTTPWGTQTDKTYQTNIVVAATASETNPDNMVPVQLPSGALRTALNLPENPDMYGKEVLIYGSLEGYFSVAGIKNPTYAVVDGKELGTKPVETTGEEILNETLLTQASFDKFTVASVTGDEYKWTFDAKYGAKMSGYNNDTKTTVPNEDWFITPAMDLTGKSAASICFNHAFGPASSVPNTDATKAQYTVWVSNDFNGDVKTATWTELKGMVYGTTAWGYVSSGDLAIPAENLKANCRVAWKYVCNDVSATWEIKEVIVK